MIRSQFKNTLIKIYKSIILYFALFLIETAINTIITLIYSWGYALYYKVYFDEILFILLFWNIRRLTLYYLPLVTCFILISKKLFLLNTSRVLIISIYNSLVLIVLTFIYSLGESYSTIEFNSIILLITVISTFLAPIVIVRKLYFKRLIESF